MGEGRHEEQGEVGPAGEQAATDDDQAGRGQAAMDRAVDNSAQQEASSKPMSFERAEFDAPASGAATGGGGAAMQCSSCNADLINEYYVANDRPLCQRCHHTLQEQLASGGGGSLPAALAWGIGGAVLGAGLYYAVSAISGYEIGLVAIVVGILVGKGVRKGAGLGHHWVYRALGLSLTYLAIVSTYMPEVVQGMMAPEPSAAEVGADGSALGADLGDAAPSGAAAATTDAEPVATATDSEPIALATLTPVALVVAFALCLVAPVLMLMEGQIMGLIILAIGLWEGYKFSAAPKISSAGPFKINAPNSVQSPTS